MCRSVLLRKQSSLPRREVYSRIHIPRGEKQGAEQVASQTGQHMMASETCQPTKSASWTCHGLLAAAACGELFAD